MTACLILVCIRTRKNACPSRQALNLFDCLQSNCAGNLTGAQAACASVHSFRRAVYDCFHSFHIGFPCSVGTSVRVRNLDAESNIFTAEFTLSHSFEPPRWFISMGPSRLIAGEAHRWVKKVSGNIITDRGGNCKAYFAVFCKNPAPITASSPRSRGAWPAP